MDYASQHYFAPQMHEIAPFLPEKVENNNYAEAYAKMYLKLKREGIL